jgi:hypothetical protein
VIASLNQRLETRAADALLVILCILVFAHGVSATADLEWGSDVDHYRDVAAAQSVLDGYFWSDPLYLGESLWYSPLTPALVAGVSWLTNSPVHVVHTPGRLREPFSANHILRAGRQLL